MAQLIHALGSRYTLPDQPLPENVGEVIGRMLAGMPVNSLAGATVIVLFELSFDVTSRQQTNFSTQYIRKVTASFTAPPEFSLEARTRFGSRFTLRRGMGTESVLVTVWDSSGDVLDVSNESRRIWIAFMRYLIQALKGSAVHLHLLLPERV